eukprot:218193_1
MEFAVVRDSKNCISNYCIKIKNIPSNRLKPNATFYGIKESSIDLQDDEIRLIRINIDQSITNVRCPQCKIYLQSIPLTPSEICLICYNYPHCQFPLNQPDYHQRWVWKQVRYIGPVTMTMDTHTTDKQWMSINQIKQDKLEKRMKKKAHSLHQSRATFTCNTRRRPHRVRKNRIKCICGSPLIESTVNACYPLNTIVECNDCDRILIDASSVLYHCNRSKVKMKEHEDGYDLCRKCALKRMDKTRNQSELYCICRQPYDGDESMVCCDVCDEWYHLSCIGMDTQTFEEAVHGGEYKCIDCILEIREKQNKAKRQRKAMRKVQMNSDCKVIAHQLNAQNNRYQFKIQTPATEPVSGWRYGDELDADMLGVLVRYLKQNHLQCVECIVGHQTDCMNHIAFRIKWKGFRQGFDEWLSSGDLMGSNVYWEYCTKNGIIDGKQSEEYVMDLDIGYEDCVISQSECNKENIDSNIQFTT